MGNHLSYLDRLRAIAILGVLVVHASQFSFANLDFQQGPEQAIFTILSAGRFGVGLFFLLSGFLLSYIYEPRISSKSSREYFIARFLRIWPLWLFFTIVWAIVYALTLSDTTGKPVDLQWILIGVFLSAFFALWLSPDHFENFLGGAWSIQIEVVSYVVFAWLRGKSISTILTVAIAINILGLVSAFIGDLVGWGILDALRRLGLQTGFNFFVLGWLLARVYVKQIHQSNQSKTNPHLSVRESFASVLSGKEWLFGAWIASFIVSPAIYGNSIEAVGFVCLSALIAHITANARTLARLLEKTGKLSYFMFFMHFVILHLLNLVVPVAIRPDSLPLVLILNVFVIVGLFIVSYLPALVSLKYFERPLLSLGKKGSHP